jgi:hypothetical protein
LYKCIGCDNIIPWDGKTVFSYTCGCGATIFYNEDDGKLTMPASVVINISRGIAKPHLNDLVGEADCSTPIKIKVIQDLVDKGFIWKEECAQCKADGTLKRHQERNAYYASMRTKQNASDQELVLDEAAENIVTERLNKSSMN